jgi:hypothetical protein
MRARAIGYGEGTYSGGRYGGPMQNVIDTTMGEMYYVENVIAVSLAMLKDEMAKRGI